MEDAKKSNFVGLVDILPLFVDEVELVVMGDEVDDSAGIIVVLFEGFGC